MTWRILASVTAVLIVLAGCATRTPDAMMGERVLIITADDYGACESINRGIRAGIDAGVVTTVAAMASFGRSATDIARLHANYPEVGIGLHASITSGFPVSGTASVPSLVNADGRFYTLSELLTRLERVDPVELERELRAQLAVFDAAGVPIDNLSSQHNILALYTPFFEVMLRLAAERDLPMRSTIPASLALPAFSRAPTRRRGVRMAARLLFSHPRAAFRMAKYGRLSEMRGNQAKLDSAGIVHPDLLVDVFWGAPTSQQLERILTELPTGVSELVVHLGIIEPAEPVPSGVEGEYFPSRELELSAVTAPRFRMKLSALGVELAGFSDLSSKTE